MEIYVSGETGIMNDLTYALVESIDITTIVTIILVVVLLFIIYRSPVAVLVPLSTIGIAYLIPRYTGVYGEWVSACGLSWMYLLSYLFFGAGTDYCLFMVSRYKEELKRRETRLEALRATVGSIGSVITASAFAVIIGLAGLTIAEFGMLQTMGLALAIAVLLPSSRSYSKSGACLSLWQIYVLA